MASPPSPSQIWMWVEVVSEQAVSSVVSRAAVEGRTCEAASFSARLWFAESS